MLVDQGRKVGVIVLVAVLINIAVLVGLAVCVGSTVACGLGVLVGTFVDVAMNNRVGVVLGAPPTRTTTFSTRSRLESEMLKAHSRSG